MAAQEREDAEDAAYVESNIPIANLKLDELNFRTDEVDSQRAAIRTMIDEQGFGLVELAEHYLKHGLMPGERLLVIPDDEEGEAETFVVMEGNRRTTVMKLLERPALAAETPVSSRFIELARQFATKPRRSLPCVILPGREAAYVWVEVKHSTGMGGAGVDQWNAPATARFGEYVRGKFTRWRATLRFLQSQGGDIKSISDGISNKTTAVSRVLNAGAMRDVLGVRFLQEGSIEFENGDVAAGVRLLTTMMTAMAAHGFSTNDVHSFDDRVDFIEGFAALAVKTSAAKKTGKADDRTSHPANDDADKANADSEGKNRRGRRAPNDRTSDDGNGSDESSGGSRDAEETEAGASTESAQSSQRRGVRRHPRQRTTLASTRRGDDLSIVDARINQLYHEARKLKVDKHTAIAAVLIRVFLELSCEHYLSSNDVAVPDHIGRRNGGRPTTWHTFGVRFREKIEAALDHADPDKTNQEFGEIRRGLGSQDHLTSPENLHDYVHGLKTIPSDRDLIIIWDRYHPLFVRMFS